MVVAGEASGDSHAAALVNVLRSRRADLRFFGMGGPKLRAAGLEVLFDADEISVMGITEVLPKLFRILHVLRSLVSVARHRRPVAAILVDVPDFNLRLARQLKRMGIPVIYYVSPMVWAWRKGRLKQIERDVDRMLCILPFEESFYRQAGVSARYVGSPVLEQMPPPAPVEQFRTQLGLPQNVPTVALLPGSRRSEIRRMLPSLIEAAGRLKTERPELQFVLPVAPGMDSQAIAHQFEGSGVKPILVSGHAPEAVAASDAAVVTSGTATLEAGLMGRPFLVIYRVSWISYWVGKLFLKVAHIALVNLLAGKRLVPELLQSQMTGLRIADEVKRLLAVGPERDRMIEGLHEVRRNLGPTGAADRAADEVLSLLSSLNETQSTQAQRQLESGAP
jgi:lipid-A-disaccharide synthase